MDLTQKPYYLHGVGEITGLTAENLNFEALNANFKDILTKVGINIIKSNYHEFPGGGHSIVYILSASHLAIHTWPESDFMHLDLVSCSPKTDFEKIEKMLMESYPNAKIKISLLDY